MSWIVSHQRPALVTLIIVFFLVFAAVANADQQYKVSRVTDGDTIRVRAPDSQTDIIVRLVGIDAPETSKGKRQPGQPFSQTASKHLAALTLNKMVSIREYGQDRYGRTLGEVSVNGTDINLEMVRAGLAEVYRGTPAPGFDNDPYFNTENEAQEAGRGMWSLGDRYMSPRQWRMMQKN